MENMDTSNKMGTFVFSRSQAERTKKDSDVYQVYDLLNVPTEMIGLRQDEMTLISPIYSRVFQVITTNMLSAKCIVASWTVASFLQRYNVLIQRYNLQ